MDFNLLIWAGACLVIAVIAWIVGYSRYVTRSASWAKFMFVFFVVLFITLLILSLIGVEPETPPALAPAT